MSDLGSVLMSLFNVLPVLATLGICLFYLIRKGSVDSVLLSIGSGIHVLTSVLYAIILPFFVYNNHSGIGDMQWVYRLGSIAGFIGSVIFLIGLLLLIQTRLALDSSPKKDNEMERYS